MLMLTSGKPKGEEGVEDDMGRFYRPSPERYFQGEADSSWKGKKLSLGIDSGIFITILD